MGYNLTVACHTHRQQCGALRGDEAKVIKRWAQAHPRSQGCRLDITVDNGWSNPEPDWAQNPHEGGYEDVYEQIMPDCGTVVTGAAIRQ